MDPKAIHEAVRRFFQDVLEGKHGREIRRRAVKAAMRHYSPTSDTGKDLFAPVRSGDKALMRRRRRIAVKAARRREGFAAGLDASERMRKAWATRRTRYGASGKGDGGNPLRRLGQRPEFARPRA